MQTGRYTLLLLIALILTQCESGPRKLEHTAMTKEDRQRLKKPDRLFGEPLFSTDKYKQEENNGIGVNKYLWRAALDTLRFMPFDKIDPFSGVLTTHWHTAKDQPHIRMKATVVVLTPRLRVDGLKISLFHQEKDAKGNWVSKEVGAEVIEQLEDAILHRARELKVDSKLEDMYA